MKMQQSNDAVTIDGISYDPEDFTEEQKNFYTDMKVTDVEIQKMKFTLHILEDYQQRCVDELSASLANNETSS